MPNILTWLSRCRFPYEPLITVEVSKGRLLHNLDEFRKLAPGGKVAPVLKSNAYGHGLLEVAKVLDKEDDIPFFVVDSYYEAIALRARHIRTPILVIGYTRPETIASSRLKKVAFTVTSLDMLKAIDDVWHEVHIHLKIDTGMRRQGLMPEEIDQAVDIIRQNHKIVLEGVCSHFSAADDPDEASADSQVNIWNKVAKQIRNAIPGIRYFHIAATDGHRFSAETDANISRLGIGLYGLSENESLNKELKLLPVMKMRTIVTGVKKLKMSETVGYGNTFKAPKDMTVATIPVGYFEGLDRRLSNKGFVQVGPRKIMCPIVGRVSMNITSIDISEVTDTKIGDEATVISDDSKDKNSIASMAKLCGTITYEMAVKIPEHLKRMVIG